MTTTTGTYKRSPARRQKGQFPWSAVLSYLVLVLVALFYLGPLFMLLNTALKTVATFMRDPTSLTTVMNFQNFTTAWQKANFPKYLTNSVTYTAAATAIFVATAVFVAFPLARGYVKGSNFLYTMFLIALFLPSSLIALFQLILHLGLYNKPAGYILLFLVDPIGIIILVNYIKSIPRELDEAAALDGCDYFTYVVRVIIPLIQPAIATVTILKAIGIWNDYILANIYLTNKNFYPITRALIVFQGVYGNQWPLMAAATLMLALPIVILYLFLQRYIISGFTAGSLRG